MKSNDEVDVGLAEPVGWRDSDVAQEAQEVVRSSIRAPGNATGPLCADPAPSTARKDGSAADCIAHPPASGTRGRVAEVGEPAAP